MAVNAQFISSLPVGAKFRMGNFKHIDDQEAMVWTIISKDHHTKDSNYPANAVTAMADKLLLFMAFDGREMENALNDRASSGNNRYRQSNIKQWMNTDLGANEWFVPQNIEGTYHYSDRDAPPSEVNISSNTNHYPYDNLMGFMGMFRDYERDLFLKTKVKTATHPLYDYEPTIGQGKGSYDETEDTFFLLSSSELGYGDNKYNDSTLDTIAEGVPFDYFVENPTRKVSKSSRLAFNKSLYNSIVLEDSGIDLDTDFPYFTRSSDLNSTHRVIEAYGADNTSADSAYKFSGLKPAVNITDQTLVSMTPDADGIYEVLADVAPVVEVLSTNVLTVDYTVRDMKGLAQEVQIFLNNELLQTVTTNLNTRLQITLPYEKIIDGNNELVFVSKDNADLERSQLFKIHVSKGSFEVGDNVAVRHETLEIVDVTDNNDGTFTIELDKNLKDTVKASETLENINFKYIPHVFVTDDYFAEPMYEPMNFKMVSYDQAKKFVTEEWEMPVNGSYVFTKILLNRSSIHDETFLKKISQTYNFSEYI